MENKKDKKNNKLVFYLINFIIVVFVSALTIYKIIKENGMEAFSYIREMSVFSISILTLIFFANLYLDGVIISIAMKEYKKKFSPVNGFVIQSVGGLFSAITPLKIGYLPSLGYAYSRFNVKGEEVIKSMAKTSYTYQFLSVIMSVIALIVCLNKQMIVYIGDVELNLKHVALIGIIYNLVLMMGYFILALSPSLHAFILKIIGWLLFKLKKIENKEEYIENKKQKMALIRAQIKSYFKDVKQFLSIFLIYVFKTMFYGCLPYIIYLLITKESFQVELWLYSIVIGDLISYITNIIPIPGASGAAEVVFISAFSLIFSPVNLLTSVMLIWRIFSYFMRIIVGFIVFITLINVKKKSSVIE